MMSKYQEIDHLFELIAQVMVLLKEGEQYLDDSILGNKEINNLMRNWAELLRNLDSLPKQHNSSNSSFKQQLIDRCQNAYCFLQEKQKGSDDGLIMDRYNQNKEEIDKLCTDKFHELSHNKDVVKESEAVVG